MENEFECLVDGGHFAVPSQSYHGNRVAIRLLLVVTRQHLTISAIISKQSFFI